MNSGNTHISVLVYVDDLIVVGNNHITTIPRFKAYLSACFHLKDLGVLKYFPGAEVARSPDGFFVSKEICT